MIYEITNTSIISPISGEWEVEQTPINFEADQSSMNWEAVHPDYDGVEDGCTEVVHADSLEGLVEEIRFWDSE